MTYYMEKSKQHTGTKAPAYQQRFTKTSECISANGEISNRFDKHVLISKQSTQFLLYLISARHIF